MDVEVEVIEHQTKEKFRNKKEFMRFLYGCLSTQKFKNDVKLSPHTYIR